MPRRIPPASDEPLQHLVHPVERTAASTRYVQAITFDLQTESVPVAADIGVPADQLSIYIRVHKYKSVLNWRKELRIQEAREMLLSYPELPISVIGEMVGIDDKTNFKRQFRQVMGTRPRDWREQHLG